MLTPLVGTAYSAFSAPVTLWGGVEKTAGPDEGVERFAVFVSCSEIGAAARRCERRPDHLDGGRREAKRPNAERESLFQLFQRSARNRDKAKSAGFVPHRRSKKRCCGGQARKQPKPRRRGSFPEQGSPKRRRQDKRRPHRKERRHEDKARASRAGRRSDRKSRCSGKRHEERRRGFFRRVIRKRQRDAAGSNRPVTFGGKDWVEVPPGQDAWSDAAALPFVPEEDAARFLGRKLAISFHVAGESGPMTWHAKASPRHGAQDR